MKFNGKLTRISIIDQQQDIDIAEETSCVLEISSKFEKSSGEGRTRNNILFRNSWSVKGDALLCQDNFIVFFDSIKNGKNLILSIDTPVFTITGDAIVTSFSFSSDKNKTIRLSFSAQGNGKPTLSDNSD